MKIVKWLDDHFEEALLIVLLVLISCVELIQVICRNVPFLPVLTWAEEFCRYCWIWSVFLSLPYTIRKGSMLRVTVLMDVFPQVVRSIINIAVDLFTTGAMVLLAVHSVGVISKVIASGETTPAMRWPMWIIYSIMFIGFFGGAVRGLQQAYLHIKHFNDKKLSTKEQAMADAKAESDAGKKAEGVNV